MPESDQHHLPSPRPVALTNVIGAHLEKVLSSRVFRTADSLRELLRFTVDETIAGRGGRLKEYLLGTTVLGKSDSFDPKVDPIVRVQMRRLRKRLDRYYATEGRYDSLLIEIPKGSYAPTFRPAVHHDGFTVPASREETLLVGREKELTELHAAFESAAAGQGRLFCLAGEPGIGKTTIVELFLRELATSRVNCFIARGRCSERLAGSEAYLPVLEALETVLRGGGEPLARLMSAVAPTWYVEIAPPAAHPAADRALTESRVASQVRLKRELVTFLEELARRQPVVIFLDDLHWADASTVDMLAYAITRCSSQRVLIIGTYRTSELSAAEHPFGRVKLELQGHGICREIAMPFLTRANVERYLALQFPEHQFPSELSVRIHDRTEGNPLFMVDLVRFLRDRGVFAQAEGHWVIVGQFPEVEHDLPESVRSMVQKKLSELNDADRTLMSAAAVQGHEFDSAVVARALEIDPTDAEKRLEGLDRMYGFVRLIGDRELPDTTLTLRYRFVHVLYQNALHNALTATRKASLSIAVARALVEFYKDQAGDVAANLALLFETGRDFARASDFFLMAAQNAGRVYAAQEAIALARRAIVNAEKLTGRERSSRVMRAALHSASQYESLIRPDEAIADFDLAEGAAAELGQLDSQLHAIFRKGSTLVLTKRLSEVREQAARALHLAEAASSPQGIASSHVILAMEQCAAGEVAVAAQLLDRAIPVLRENDPFNHALWAVLLRGVIDTYQLEHGRADLALRWAYERAGDLRVSFYALMALVHRARTRGNQGQLSEAWSMLEEAWRLAELVGDGFWLASVANARGWLLSELFATETALRLNAEALRLAREFGIAEIVRISHINVARDFLALGDLEQAWEHLKEADARDAQDVWFHWVYYPRVQAEMASCWIVRGDLHQARCCARDSLEHAERTLSRKRMAWAHKLLGDIAVLEDRVQDGRREFDAASRILEHHACPTIEWPILRAAADAAGALGDHVARSELQGRGRAVIEALADSVRDAALRRTFLGAKPIRWFSS